MHVHGRQFVNHCPQQFLLIDRKTQVLWDNIFWNGAFSRFIKTKRKQSEYIFSWLIKFSHPCKHHTINKCICAHFSSLVKTNIRIIVGFCFSLCYMLVSERITGVHEKRLLRWSNLQLLLLLGRALAVVALELHGGVLGNVLDKVIQVSATLLKQTKYYKSLQF